MDMSSEMEQGEWLRVNRDLRQHGLPSVEISDPRQLSAADAVTFSTDATKMLRSTIATLLRDCDRRQELIQELIVTNNQLREDVKRQTMLSETFDRQSRDLKVQLEQSQAKVQDMEDELGSVSTVTREEGERLRNTKDAASARCAQLAKKCEVYEEEIDRLQKKLKHLNLQDERRHKKLDEVMSQIRRKWTRGGTTDDNMLSVIDWYENQVSKLNVELQQAHHNHDNHSDYHDDGNKFAGSSSTDGATNNYKALVKSYERQLRDFKKKMNNLENEKELLKLDLESRPQLKDFRDVQAKNKKMERILKNHGICVTHDAVPPRKANKLYSSKVEDLEFLPVAECRQYLKTTCTDLGVTDLRQLSGAVAGLQRTSEGQPRLEKFAISVLEVLHKSPQSQEKSVSHAVWCDKSLHRGLATLESWQRQLSANKELQESIHRLSSTLYPWKQLNHHDNPTSMQMVTLVDSLIEESAEGGDQNSQIDRGSKKEQPPREMLRGIVEHFQQLFDVPRVSGVYARMNDVYTKLGEVHNILRTLRDVIGLDEKCKPFVIIDMVTRMMESQEKSEKIQELLDREDMESLLRRLDEHDTFFPLFQDLVQKEMAILNVTHIDEIIPAVKALKLLAGC